MSYESERKDIVTINDNDALIRKALVDPGVTTLGQGPLVPVAVIPIL